jgi:hypothetical protein
MISAHARALAPRGFIGVHNSLLPRYRGAAPLVWALMHGEREVGLSMYTLTDGMDDGDLWAQTSTAVAPDEYIGTVLERLEEACERMIRDVYPRIFDDSLSPVPQDGAQATYGTIRTPAHGRIDWHEPGEDIGAQSVRSRIPIQAPSRRTMVIVSSYGERTRSRRRTTDVPVNLCVDREARCSSSAAIIERSCSTTFRSTTRRRTPRPRCVRASYSENFENRE